MLKVFNPYPHLIIVDIKKGKGDSAQFDAIPVKAKGFTNIQDGWEITGACRQAHPKLKLEFVEEKSSVKEITKSNTSDETKTEDKSDSGKNSGGGKGDSRKQK